MLWFAAKINKIRLNDMSTVKTNQVIASGIAK